MVISSSIKSYIFYNDIKWLNTFIVLNKNKINVKITNPNKWIKHVRIIIPIPQWLVSYHITKHIIFALFKELEILR